MEPEPERAPSTGGLGGDDPEWDVLAVLLDHPENDGLYESE